MAQSTRRRERSRSAVAEGRRTSRTAMGRTPRSDFPGRSRRTGSPTSAKTTSGRELTIHDNRGICAHAARCTGTLKTVFKYGQEPWIDPNGDTVDKIVATVRQCPSGALSYSIDGVEASRPRGRSDHLDCAQRTRTPSWVARSSTIPSGGRGRPVSTSTSAGVAKARTSRFAAAPTGTITSMSTPRGRSNATALPSAAFT